MSDIWVGFTVATLCRILTMIEDGEIAGKRAALACWRPRLPGEWGLLIEEAARLRRDPRAPSRYRSRVARMRVTIAFVRYAPVLGARSDGSAGAN